MKLNTNSNSYIIIYSTLLVLVVAFLLAFVTTALKERQDKNVALDTQKQILYALNQGEKISGLDDDAVQAFYAATVTRTDSIADEKGKQRPYIYYATVDGEPKYVLPLKGQGMWGGISCFLALDGDRETVFGAYFNHESETAGLGAEIKDNPQWRQKFQGKRLFTDDGAEIALSVEKNVNDATTVDAVTGATVTSTAVSKMLQEQLAKYKDFLKQ